MAHAHSTLEHAIADGNIAKIPTTLRAAFKVDAGRPQDAVIYGYVLCWPALPECSTTLEDNSVVYGFDKTVGDTNIPATIGIDTVGVTPSIVTNSHPSRLML